MNDEERAARLLRGKNAPSALERERIVDQILDEVDGGRKRGRWLRPVSLVLAAGAAVAALVVVTRPPGELTPRAGGNGAVIETICVPGPECRRGGQLLLRVSNVASDAGYLAAFSKRPDGLVIWYFPQSEESASAPFSANQWLDEGIILDEAHRPGEYTIHALVSEEALTRSTVREIVEAGGDAEHLLLQAKVRVMP
jgi:hypothetical protein